MNRLALFDCDGTLVDSQHNIILCMDDAFARAGLVPPSRAATRRVVGLSLVPAMQALLPEAEPALHAQLAEDYKSAFHRLRGQGLVEEPLFEGIAAALDALEAQGWLLGVATGKSDRGLDLCLRHHGLRDRFVTLQTADRHPSKPHPSMVEQAMADAGATPETTVMIGDTSFDMAMGVAAGARALGVDWGYHDPDDLWAAGAYHIASHPAQILEAL
ncbi:MAG: HAD-IA family hydrolase [Chakrabartia sp.]